MCEHDTRTVDESLISTNAPNVSVGAPSACRTLARGRDTTAGGVAVDLFSPIYPPPLMDSTASAASDVDKIPACWGVDFGRVE